MSSFWKKLKGGYAKDDNTALSHDSGEATSSKSTGKHLSTINPDDEEIYFKNSLIRNTSTDLLHGKSQSIRCLRTVLLGSSALPYFLEFLRIYDVEQYALCWTECEKFRHLAKQLVELSAATKDICPKDSEEDIIQNTSVPAECNKDCIYSDKSYKTENNDKSYPGVLPDLVSNIPQDAPVTPLPSPDKIVSQSSPINSKGDKSDLEGKQFVQNPSSAIVDSYKSVAKICDTQVYNNINQNLCLINSRDRLSALALQIFNDYINYDSSRGSVPVIKLSHLVRHKVEDKMKTSENVINCDMFIPVQEELFSYIESEYFPKFFDSEYFLKFEVDVFTSRAVTLQDIISCDSALPYFMEYMDQEGGQHLLEFFLSAFNFREHLKESKVNCSFSTEEAQADAMILYDKYFSLQATHTLGFSDRIRFLVESNICQESGPSTHCFDASLEIVLRVIHRDYLSSYLSSSLHVKYVSELVNNLRVSTLGRKTRSGSESTCSSEQSANPSSSISRSNTLLAMDTSSSSKSGSASGNRLIKNIDDTSLSMRIDSIQILDPDSLWRRKNFTKLSCGYVDEFGRFESDLQTEPDRKSESKISKKLKKFANIEENKVKEEMAYKVAEMIIKDVTSVTLRHSKRHSVSEAESQYSPLGLRTPVTSKMTRSSSEVFSYRRQPDVQSKVEPKPS